MLEFDSLANSILTASVVATVLVHLDKLESVLPLAGIWFVVNTTLQKFGVAESSATLICAGVLGLKIVPMLFKRIVTIAATFPLALAFKYVTQIIPKYTINETDFWSCDGCSDDVAKRRKDALLTLSEKWKQKYKKCLDFSSELKKKDVGCTVHLREMFSMF